jgi:hypothetical protein
MAAPLLVQKRHAEHAMWWKIRNPKTAKFECMKVLGLPEL